MEIYNQLNEFISGEILRQPGRQLQSDEPLISSGLIDSFSLVDLSIFVEEKFGVQIDDTELNTDTFDNLDQLIKLIKERQ